MFGLFTRKCSPQVATDNKHLRKLVIQHIDKYGPYCDLNHIDVSQVKDFTGIFANTVFNGDISRWNVSNAVCMHSMFAHSLFNGDISQWDVSKVTSMHSMFAHSVFNGDISRWNVSSVIAMNAMFAESLFNSDISKWDVSSVITMNGMFMSSAFCQCIADWNVSRVEDMSVMFYQSAYKGDVSRWDLRSLKYATHVFDSPYFESDLPTVAFGNLVSGSSFVSAAFRGQLGNDIKEYSGVRKIFPNATSAYNYVGYLYKKLGPGVLHIDYALNHFACPSWFDAALFDWVKQEQAMCEKMGMSVQIVCDVVKNDFLSGSSDATAQRADSIPFEFEAIRCAA